MEGPGLFVNGIFVKLEEDIEEKKNGNLNSASPHFNFSLIIKKDESGMAGIFSKFNFRMLAKLILLLPIQKNHDSLLFLPKSF